MKAMQKPEQTKAKHIFKKRIIQKDKYLVDKNMYIASGWIDPVFPSVGEVVTSHTRRDMTGSNDLAYIKINKGYETVGKFFVIRAENMVKHPDTGMVLGHQVKVQGVLEVIRQKNGIYEANILKSYEDIVAGDGLLPFTALEPPIIPRTAREPELGGYIVAAHAYTVISGKGDIVFLDKGENDGLKVGDVFSVLSDPPVERSIGKLQLISLKPTTSGAVVIQSEDEIEVGARFGQD